MDSELREDEMNEMLDYNAPSYSSTSRYSTGTTDEERHSRGRGRCLSQRRLFSEPSIRLTRKMISACPLGTGQ